MNQKVTRTKILIPLIEDSYRAEYTEYKRRNLRCSDAGAAVDEGEKCEREIYYDFTVPEKKSLLSTGTLVLFDDGRIGESDIRRRLRLVLRSPERELTDEELGCRGKIDNMVERKKIISEGIEGIEIGMLEGDPILEIKTVNEFSYQMMARDGQISQSYYDQIQYYLLLSGAKWAICLIKNRNSSGDEKGVIPYLEFTVMPDPARQAAIRAGLKTIVECVAQKIMPPRPFLKDSTKCSYCRFKYECWGAPEKTLDVPAAPTTEVAPDQEMVESALKVYSAMATQIAEFEVVQEQAKAVLLRFFRATKLPETQVADVKATYSTSAKSYIDSSKLLNMIGTVRFSTMAKADTVKSDKMSEYLRVSKIKTKTERVKVDGNDKGNIGSAKDTEVGKDPARDKSKDGSRKRVPKRSGLLPARSGRTRSKKKGRADKSVQKAVRG
jgi:CRISPR/Cas system-associated exonuclease Cas4 (RecB family)